MKSKQSKFEDIIIASINKAREKVVAGAKDEFELRMKSLSKTILELDADPYLFVFEALSEYKECGDFLLTQYLVMVEENFLNTTKNASILVKHFRMHLSQHSFKIIQIILKIKQPNLEILSFFFELHASVTMPENILDTFRHTGYRWLTTAFAFKKLPKPLLAQDITSGILKSQNGTLPSLEDEHRSLQKYIEKIVNNMAMKVESDLEPECGPKPKYGFCLMCSKPANYYCKDTKIPVCGSECKKAHINYISNSPIIDFQYSDSFRREIEDMLVENIRRKRNLALSIDYLCSIFINSTYIPRCPLPHKEVLTSPVIAERVWLLYIMHYHRKNQLFEHIFADGLQLTDPNYDYLKMNCGNYFLKLVQNNSCNRMLQVYQSLDAQGFRRIIPTILSHLPEEGDCRARMVSGLINLIYNNTTAYKEEMEEEEKELGHSALLRAINYEKQPLKIFGDRFGEEGSVQMVRFMIKNESLIKRDKICDIVANDDDLCRVFLRELLYGEGETNRLRLSPLIDEILREIFYFINIKVSDKIYRLLEILCEELSLQSQDQSQCEELHPHHPSLVFSHANTESPDCFFQFAYFIIMITTELHKKQDPISRENFLKRVKDFDKVFAAKQSDYILGVYDRITALPFTQTQRGILVHYPPVPNKWSDKQKFNPLCVLLENWEQCYQILMGSAAETGLLYRCCSLLTGHPQLCQPFLQMLLNKVDCGDWSKEEHLLPSIKSILQEEPNCVGGAWKQLFLKNPANNQFLFNLSELEYISKSLTNSNFIWFVRNFCSAVTLSANHRDCLKLLHNNYSIRDSAPQRVQILTKEMLNLFTSEYNVYYQQLFTKGVFHIGMISFGCTLLQLIPINLVSQPLLVTTLNSIIKDHWREIEAADHTFKQENSSEEDVGPTWTHILNKMCTIAINNPSMIESLSKALKDIPDCYKYFEEFNILQSIALAPESEDLGHEVKIHPQLTSKLSRFRKNIPQMSPSLLQQFIHKDNSRAISNNFKYFWKLGDVYTMLADCILDGQSDQIDFETITDVLSHAQYLKEINRQEDTIENIAQISPILSFAMAVIVYGPVINKELYTKIFQQVLGVVKLEETEKLSLRQFICNGKVLFQYLSTLRSILQRNPHAQAIGPIEKVRQYLHTINLNYDLRVFLMNQKEEEIDVAWDAPPGLLLQEQIANFIFCCLYKTESNCGLAISQFLSEKFPVFSNFMSSQAKKRSKKAGQEQMKERNWTALLSQKSVKSLYQTLEQICQHLQTKGTVIEKLEERVLFEFMHEGFDFYNPNDGSFKKKEMKSCPIYRLFKLKK